MKYRKLGRTGLMVSEICLGTMTFGNQIDEAESSKLITWALDTGINFVDVADMYVNGLTEEIVGKTLRDKRHSVVLATKVGAWQSGPDINDIGLSRKHIMDGIEGSLRRLGTDYIDIYYAHKPDNSTPIEETLRAFTDLIKQGKVRYIGCSNYLAWQLCKALWTSDLHNLARYDCIQPPYNLLIRGIEDELLPLSKNEGVGVCVFNPLAAGLLTGKHDPGIPPAEGTRFSNKLQGKVYSERYWLPSNFEAVAKVKEVTEKHGHSMAQFSLAWILSNPAITSIICGANSIKQMEENVGAVELAVTEDEFNVCNEIWNTLRPQRFFYGSQQLYR